ncbi:MAG: FkbM family methyltransferase [Actinomycetota bacterium]
MLTKLVLKAAATPAFHRLRGHPVIGPLLIRALELALRNAPTVTSDVTRGPLAGLTFELDPRMQADILTGTYEQKVHAALWDALSPGDTAFDVGSHFGYFGLVMAVRTGEPGRVVCFEPDPDNVEVLRRNVERNAATFDHSVEVAPLALGAAPDRARFSRGRHTSQGKLSDAGEVDVEVITLDQAVERYGRPRVVKIDVEGFEQDVLLGGASFVAERHAAFVIEIHREDLGEACSKLLEDDGYRCERFRLPGRAESYLVARA